METINAIGRRKASVARIYVSNGTGKIKINGRELIPVFMIPTRFRTLGQVVGRQGLEP